MDMDIDMDMDMDMDIDMDGWMDGGELRRELHALTSSDNSAGRAASGQRVEFPSQQPRIHFTDEPTDRLGSPLFKVLPQS